MPAEEREAAQNTLLSMKPTAFRHHRVCHQRRIESRHRGDLEQLGYGQEPWLMALGRLRVQLGTIISRSTVVNWFGQEERDVGAPGGKRA